MYDKIITNSDVVIIGGAIDTGYIRSVDEPVRGFFPEYMVKSNGGHKREVTISSTGPALRLA